MKPKPIGATDFDNFDKEQLPVVIGIVTDAEATVEATVLSTQGGGQGTSAADKREKPKGKKRQKKQGAAADAIPDAIHRRLDLGPPALTQLKDEHVSWAGGDEEDELKKKLVDMINIYDADGLHKRIFACALSRARYGADQLYKNDADRVNELPAGIKTKKKGEAREALVVNDVWNYLDEADTSDEVADDVIWSREFHRVQTARKEAAYEVHVGYKQAEDRPNATDLFVGKERPQSFTLRVPGTPGLMACFAHAHNAVQALWQLYLRGVGDSDKNIRSLVSCLTLASPPQTAHTADDYLLAVRHTMARGILAMLYNDIASVDAIVKLGERIAEYFTDNLARIQQLCTTSKKHYNNEEYAQAVFSACHIICRVLLYTLSRRSTDVDDDVAAAAEGLVVTQVRKREVASDDMLVDLDEDQRHDFEQLLWWFYPPNARDKDSKPRTQLGLEDWLRPLLFPTTVMKNQRLDLLTQCHIAEGKAPARTKGGENKNLDMMKKHVGVWRPFGQPLYIERGSKEQFWPASTNETEDGQRAAKKYALCHKTEVLYWMMKFVAREAYVKSGYFTYGSWQDAGLTMPIFAQRTALLEALESGSKLDEVKKHVPQDAAELDLDGGNLVVKPDAQDGDSSADNPAAGVSDAPGASAADMLDWEDIDVLIDPLNFDLAISQ